MAVIKTLMIDEHEFEATFITWLSNNEYFMQLCEENVFNKDISDYFESLDVIIQHYYIVKFMIEKGII